MKNFLTLISILIFTSKCFGASELFQYNQPEISYALKNVSALEEYSIQKNYDYKEVIENNPALIENANLVFNYTSLYKPEGPLGGSPFIWGFCLGLIGVIVVVATVKGDDKALGNAIFGCVLNGVLIAVLAVLYEVVAFFSLLSSEGCY